MKKIISAFLCIIMIAAVFSACGNTQKKSAELSVVTTIFPEYDWVKNILGEKASDVDLTMLLDSGVDLHSYQPTADDIIKISTCDLFIYVGGESDEWVDDALKEATNKDMIVIDLLDILGDKAKEEETVEGMEAEEVEADEEEAELDEHVWLSLKNAEIFCNEIKNAIVKLDSENSELYEANTKAYTEKLSALDNEYAKAVENSRVKTLLFGDRFPFRYLVDDYGLSYYAAFSGCSAESEASFETITFLADKVKELELKSVLTLEGTNHKIAETVVATSKLNDISILSMDSLQSTTMKDAENGTTYISAMEKNLETLKEALK